MTENVNLLQYYFRYVLIAEKACLMGLRSEE
jgi:hypothetical protein